MTASQRGPFWLQMPLSLTACVAAITAASTLFRPDGVGVAAICFILIVIAAACASSGGLGGASFHYGDPSRREVILRVLALAMLVLAIAVAVLAWMSFRTAHV